MTVCPWIEKHFISTMQTHCHFWRCHFWRGVEINDENIIPGIFTWTSNKFMVQALFERSWYFSPWEQYLLHSMLQKLTFCRGANCLHYCSKSGQTDIQWTTVLENIFLSKPNGHFPGKDKLYWTVVYSVVSEQLTPLPFVTKLQFAPLNFITELEYDKFPFWCMLHLALFAAWGVDASVAAMGIPRPSVKFLRALGECAATYSSRLAVVRSFIR